MTTNAKPPRKPRVHGLIKKSSALLDEMLGSAEWDRLIDIQKFTIYSASSCVLGQTGSLNRHHGLIPGNGKVKWKSYFDGTDVIDAFSEKHPEVLERIGLKYEEVNKAFMCEVHDYYGVDQNEQWLRWLKYRRALRDWEAAQAAQASA